MKSTILLYVVLIQVFTLIGSFNTCGEDVNPSEEFLTTPNHPDYYPHNLHCIWSVTGSDGSTFRLRFGVFNIICNDTVTIYDGNSRSATTLLNKACGLNKVNEIGEITSTSNVITVEFISDDTGQSTGFYLIWGSKISDGIPAVTSPPSTTATLTGVSRTPKTIPTGFTTSSKEVSQTTTVAAISNVSRRSNAIVTGSTTSCNGFLVTTMTASAKVPVIVGAAVGGFVLGVAVTISITVCYLRRSRSTDKKKEGQYDTLNMNTSNTSAYTDLTEVSTSNMKRMNVNIDPNTQNEGKTENAENHGHYQNIEVTEEK